MAEQPTIQNNVDAATAEFEARKAEREAAGGGVVRSPMDAKTMGANADQAKMIGSQPKSLQEAADQARMQKEAAQEMQFDAIMREKQLIEANLTDEQKEAQKLKDAVAGLGTLDSLVQQYVTQAGQAEDIDGVESAMVTGIDFDIPENASEEEKAAMADIKTEYNNFLENIKNLNDGDMDRESQEYKDAIKLIESDFYETLVDISSTDWGEGETASSIVATLEALMKTDVASVTAITSRAFADGLVDPTDLSFAALEAADFTVIEDLGFDEDYLESVLGTGWKELPISDIGKIMDNEVLRSANQSANISSQLADPNVSPALKELLNEKQAQIEASGMAQIEADARQASDDVLAAGSVLFNGKVQSIESLLSDEGIQGIVQGFTSDLSTLAEKLGKPIEELTPEDMKDLELFSNNPTFANMIFNTFGNVLDSAENFAQVIENFDDIQVEVNDSINADIKSSPHGVAISSEMKEMFGITEDGLYTANPVEDHPLWDAVINNKYVAESMSAWDADTREEFKDWLNDPELADSRSTLKDLEIRLLSIDPIDEEGNPNPEYEEIAKQIEDIQKVIDAKVEKMKAEMESVVKALSEPLSSQSFYQIANIDKVMSDLGANASLGDYMGMLLGFGEKSWSVSDSSDLNLFKDTNPEQMLNRLALEGGTGEGTPYAILSKYFDKDPKKFKTNILNWFKSAKTPQQKAELALVLGKLKTTTRQKQTANSKSEGWSTGTDRELQDQLLNSGSLFVDSKGRMQFSKAALDNLIKSKGIKFVDSLLSSSISGQLPAGIHQYLKNKSFSLSASSWESLSSDTGILSLKSVKDASSNLHQAQQASPKWRKMNKVYQGALKHDAEWKGWIRDSKAALDRFPPSERVRFKAGAPANVASLSPKKQAKWLTPYGKKYRQYQRDVDWYETRGAPAVKKKMNALVPEAYNTYKADTQKAITAIGTAIDNNQLSPMEQLRALRWAVSPNNEDIIDKKTKSRYNVLLANIMQKYGLDSMRIWNWDKGIR
jgi:hypothetical protein